MAYYLLSYYFATSKFSRIVAKGNTIYLGEEKNMYVYV